MTKISKKEAKEDRAFLITATVIKYSVLLRSKYPVETDEDAEQLFYRAVDSANQELAVVFEETPITDEEFDVLARGVTRISDKFSEYEQKVEMR